MSNLTGQPIIILKEGTERNRGRQAQHNNIAAARAVASPGPDTGRAGTCTRTATPRCTRRSPGPPR